MEVTEVLSLERGRLAFASAGEDVSALVVHLGYSPYAFVNSSFCWWLRLAAACALIQVHPMRFYLGS